MLFFFFSLLMNQTKKESQDKLINPTVLPKNLWNQKIMMNLKPKDICNLGMTCKYFHKILEDNYVWYKLVQRDYPENIQKNLKQTINWKKICKKKNQKKILFIICFFFFSIFKIVVSSYKDEPMNFGSAFLKCKTFYFIFILFFIFYFLFLFYFIFYFFYFLFYFIFYFLFILFSIFILFYFLHFNFLFYFI